MSPLPLAILYPVKHRPISDVIMADVSQTARFVTKKMIVGTTRMSFLKVEPSAENAIVTIRNFVARTECVSKIPKSVMDITIA